MTKPELALHEPLLPAIDPLHLWDCDGPTLPQLQQFISIWYYQPEYRVIANLLLEGCRDPPVLGLIMRERYWQTIQSVVSNVQLNKCSLC